MAGGVDGGGEVKRRPKICSHSSGQARVIIDGRTFYLGKHGSPESLAKYEMLMSAGPSVASYVDGRFADCPRIKSDKWLQVVAREIGDVVDAESLSRYVVKIDAMKTTSCGTRWRAIRRFAEWSVRWDATNRSSGWAKIALGKAPRGVMPPTMRRHYVYVVESGGVAYVGSGVGNRAGMHLLRPEFASRKRVAIRVRFFGSEARARMAEARLIRMIGLNRLLNKNMPMNTRPRLSAEARRAFHRRHQTQRVSRRCADNGAA